METNINGTIILIALLLTGLSAGLFYAWQVSVIPGTKKVSDHSYVEVMQSINREIINPWFIIVFVGAALVLVGASILEYQNGLSPAFWFVCAATILYVFGTFGVTAIGNVPLNNMLELFKNLNDPESLNEIRAQYESRWNQLHLVRTVCAVLSMTSLLLAIKNYMQL